MPAVLCVPPGRTLPGGLVMMASVWTWAFPSGVRKSVGQKLGVRGRGSLPSQELSPIPLFLLSLKEAFPQTPHPGVSRSPRHLIHSATPACVLWMLQIPLPGGAGCSHRLPGAEQLLHDQMGMDTLPGGPRPSALAAHVPRSSLGVFHGSLFPCSSPISPSSVRP